LVADKISGYACGMALLAAESTLMKLVGFVDQVAIEH